MIPTSPKNADSTKNPSACTKPKIPHRAAATKIARARRGYRVVFDIDGLRGGCSGVAAIRIREQAEGLIDKSRCSMTFKKHHILNGFTKLQRAYQLPIQTLLFHVSGGLGRYASNNPSSLFRCSACLGAFRDFSFSRLMSFHRTAGRLAASGCPIASKSGSQS